MSETGGKPLFDALTNGLRLNNVPIRMVPDGLEVTEETPSFLFVWKHTDGKEKNEGDSYAATLEFLNTLTDNKAYNCSDGKGVGSGGNVFDVKMFSLRSKNLLTKGEVVQLVQRVKGRCDLAILRDVLDGGQLLRHHVRIGIEVKPPSVWKANSKGCEREAMVQLIGLSGNNTWAVPVILTNLVKVHRVYYLHNKSAEPLEFRIHVSLFANLAAAVQFALALPKVDHILQFGRPTSPFASSDSDQGSDTQARMQDFADCSDE
jgi:hypothetical protein